MICPQILPRVQGFQTPLRLYRSPMLSHLVSCHRSLCHLLPALPALDPYLLSLPLGGPLPRYPSLVCRLQLIPRRLKGAADHTNCITNISPQAHPIKKADQAIKCTWSQWGSDDATMPLSTQKRAAWCLPSCPRSPRYSTPYPITVTQCLSTTSTTTLYMVGESGSPCVTPRAP